MANYVTDFTPRDEDQETDVKRSHRSTGVSTGASAQSKFRRIGVKKTKP
jgi:hypothetical protein